VRAVVPDQAREAGQGSILVKGAAWWPLRAGICHTVSALAVSSEATLQCWEAGMGGGGRAPRSVDANRGAGGSACLTEAAGAQERRRGLI